jgi:hypothetical protein
MTDELKQILCDLIERHGRELVREPKRLEGMLNDACAGQHRGARRVLVDAVQERVVEELLAWGPSEQVEVVVGRAQQRLVENLAVAPDAAQWAIQAWVAALQVDGAMIPVPDFGQPTITFLSDEPDTDSSAQIAVPTQPTPSPVRSGNLAAKVRSAQADTVAKHAQARQLVSQKHDYAGAVTVLEAIPESLRDREFYEDCVFKRDRVIALRQQVTQHAQAKQYFEAAPLADELWQLQPNRADVQQARNKLVAKVNEAQQHAAKLDALARRQANEEFNYAAAVLTLDSIPYQLRDASLLKEYDVNRDRVAELEDFITTDVDAHRLHGLRPLVKELLGLQPHRDDLRELLDALPISAELLVAPFTDKQASTARWEWVNTLGQPERIEGIPGQTLVLIPPGEFDMGSSESKDEQPIHHVRITRPMWVGVTPVTQAQYQAVMGSNPSEFKGNDQRPVENVNWFDAVEFGRRTALRLPAEQYWDVSPVTPSDRMTFSASTGMASGCRRKRNGNTSAAPEARVVFASVATRLLSPSTRGMTRTRVKRRIQSEEKLQMLLDCTTCMAMSGNGVGIGMTMHTIRSCQPMIRRDQWRFLTIVYCVAALGTSSRSSHALPVETDTLPSTVAATSVFAWFVRLC